MLEIVNIAVAELTVKRDGDSYQTDNLYIAKDATRYLLDLSSNDGFAKTRARKVWEHVEASIKMRDENQELRRKKRQEEENAARATVTKKPPKNPTKK